MSLGHWKYSGEPFDVNEYFGFIYIITNKISGKKYLGRKFFHVHQKKKRVRESPWRSYTGSCKPLNADIKELGKGNFTFDIFRLYTTRGGLSYFETYHLCAHDVLTQRDGDGNRTWYNSHIGAVKWIAPMEVSEATRYKMRMARTPDKITPEKRLNMRNAQLGRKHPADVKMKISNANSGSKHPMYGKSPSDESKQKMKDTWSKRDNNMLDRTIYNWVHKDGDTRTSTKFELRTEFGMSSSQIAGVVNGRQKTSRGWSVVK